MTMQSKFAGAVVAGVALLALSGCQKPSTADQAPTTVTPPAVKLPISLNAVMVGLVGVSSDFLFAIGNGDLPRNDHEWTLVRNHAYQMVVAGKAIQIEGTGAHDAEWIANPEWKKYADELSAIGLDAVKLADAKNSKGWDAIGSRLVDNCEACHAAFKAAVPSQGILHESTKRESEGKSVFDRD